MSKLCRLVGASTDTDASLAAAAGPVHHSVRSGRRRRHRRAPYSGPPASTLGQAGGDREPSGRRQHDRDPGRHIRNDDHTFLWGPSGSFIVHPYQYKKLPYDPADLVPVARYSSTILGVGVPASMKIATLADFVKRARAEPGKFNSAAVPGITELAFDYFAHNAKITTTKVPYKDIVQAVNDLAEDRLQVYSASYAILRPQREAGRITVLAQMGRERAPSLPDIPTGIEAGFPELDMDGNVGLFGSKALPAELRERIGADVVAVSDDKAIDDKLNATAQTPSRGGAKEFAASIERQRAQIATIAKTLGIQPTR